MSRSTAERNLRQVILGLLLGGLLMWILAVPAQARASSGCTDGFGVTVATRTLGQTTPDTSPEEASSWSIGSVMLLLVKILAGTFATIVVLVVMLPIISASRVIVLKLLGKKEQ